MPRRDQLCQQFDRGRLCLRCYPSESHSSSRSRDGSYPTYPPRSPPFDPSELVRSSSESNSDSEDSVHLLVRPSSPGEIEDRGQLVGYALFVCRQIRHINYSPFQSYRLGDDSEVSLHSSFAEVEDYDPNLRFIRRRPFGRSPFESLYVHGFYAFHRWGLYPYPVGIRDLLYWSASELQFPPIRVQYFVDRSATTSNEFDINLLERSPSYSSIYIRRFIDEPIPDLDRVVRILVTFLGQVEGGPNWTWILRTILLHRSQGRIVSRLQVSRVGSRIRVRRVRLRR